MTQPSSSVPVALSMDIILSDRASVVARQIDELTSAHGSIVIGLTSNPANIEVPEGVDGVLRINLIGYHVGKDKDELLAALQEVVAAMENGEMQAEGRFETEEEIQEHLNRPVVIAPPVP